MNAMIVEKIITTTEEREINITGATLLSIAEYNQYKDLISYANGAWWLRSPGNDDSSAKCVDRSLVFYEYVDYELGVRPALIISNSDLQIEDKFKFADHIFTVISEKYALCDNIIKKYNFRTDWKVKDANNYEESDVKKWLEKWWKLNVDAKNEQTKKQILDAVNRALNKNIKDSKIINILTYDVANEIETVLFDDCKEIEE